MTALTWAEKLDLPSSQPRSLIRLFLKQQILSDDTAWTSEGGGVWSASFPYYVSTLLCRGWQGDPVYSPLGLPDYQADAIELQNVDAPGDISSAGDWSFDADTQRIWLKPYAYDTLTSVTPNDADFTFEFLVFASTHGGYYPVTPGTSQETVEWPARISRCPMFKQSFADQLFGYLPVESSSFDVRNQDGEWNKYLDSAIWKNAKFQVYNDFLLNPAQEESYRGTMLGLCENFSANENEISVSVKAFIDILDRDFDLKPMREYAFSSIATDDLDKYVRKVYGRCEGFLPLNANYNGTPSTTVNRDWVFSKDALANHPSLTFTVDHTYVNTDTTTKLTASPVGLNRNDLIKLVCNGVAKYVVIQAVNYSTKIITHTTITSRAYTAGDTLFRSFVGNLQILDNGVNYTLYPVRDYAEMDFAGCAGIRLTNNFEATVSMGSAFDPSQMIMRGIVYGIKTLATLPDSSSLGAVSNRGGAYSNPIGILLHLIRDSGRFEGAQYLVDAVSFTAEFNASDDYVGFPVPSQVGGSLPKYKDIAVKLLNSFLGRLFLKDTSSGPYFAVDRVAPTASPADYILDASEILSWSQSVNYNDAPSKMNFIYSLQESFMSDSAGITVLPVYPDGYTQSASGAYYYTFKNCKQARWGYFINNPIDFETYLDSDSVQASADQINTMGERVRWLMSERKIRITALVKNRFFQANIGDTIEVSRDAMPGYEYAFGTNRTKSFILIEKQQSVYGCTLVLDDQKGVEDHAGDW